MKCTRCKKEKLESEFYKRSDSKKGIASQCKLCHIKFMKDKHTSVKLALAELFGGQCKKCGYKEEPRILQFHHRDPSLKEFGISKRCRYSIEGLKKEAEKCDLLCPNCHALHHLNNGCDPF